MITVLFHVEETLGSVELQWNQVMVPTVRKTLDLVSTRCFSCHRCFNVPQRDCYCLFLSKHDQNSGGDK